MRVRFQVDCGKLNQFCRDEGVSSYPTMMFYDANNDMSRERVKARDHSELTAWVKEHAEKVARAGSAPIHASTLSPSIEH